MQTAESVCLWNYQYKNSYASNSLTKNLPFENVPHLTCTERLACQEEMSSRASIFCVQCNSLECSLCENELHSNSTNNEHQRLDLNQIDNEPCGIDRRHRAIFYCSTCKMFFCYLCYENQHQHSDGRDHKPQKSRLQQNDENQTQPESFENVELIEQKTQKAPQRLNCNEQMLLESMLDEDSRSTNQRTEEKNGQKGILLIDSDENLMIDNENEFVNQLESDEDVEVKTVSILGNTGDGKSFTLNKIFFDGREVFQTSPTADSCTMGVWASLDNPHRTLIFDTEGRLGLSSNDNVRNRLLLKIFSLSDIVIYRTRASKLPNDMFKLLSDASTIFRKHFQFQLEKFFKPIKNLGPTLIIFHETQHTGVLKDHFESQKTAVEQIKERFETMNLRFDGFRAIEYVGVQTNGKEKIDFSEIRRTVKEILENDSIYSARRLSMIFQALKTINENFNRSINSSLETILSDDFFSCRSNCLCCGMKCKLSANHQSVHQRHECGTGCFYNKEFDNEVWKCLKCFHEGRDTTVYGKLITRNDSLVQGLLKYVWSGCVIECPFHGEIYRSRKHWYGNCEPKDVTRIEIIHIWPDEDQTRMASDVTPRKFIELIVYASSYLSAPTKIISELVADQVAPSYWIPNRDVTSCTSCQLYFGSEFSKHHCRACGHVFCDTCSIYRRVVPWIDTENPVRVCSQCYGNPKVRQISFNKTNEIPKLDENGTSADSASTVSSGEHLNDLCLSPTDIFDIEQPGAGPVNVDIPTSRRFYETVKTNFEKIAVNYPIEFLKETTRPSYWKPDHECLSCTICKRIFNSTTNRLHHCRKCGEGVCENCSPHKRAVPERDWLTDVRICVRCEQILDSIQGDF